MLTNLFSMFDTNFFMFEPIKIMMFFFVFLVLSKSNKNFCYNKKNLMKNYFNSIFSNDMKKETFTFNAKQANIKYMGALKMLVYLFMMILFFNFTSLFPYILCITSHMSVNLTLTLNLWMLTVILALKNNYKNFFSHLTPMGTPIFLMSFMVLIETISNIIRPLTLAVRLMANMVAGHLLLTLLSQFSLMSYTNSFTSTMIFLILSSLETGVSIIQSYVITLLCFLYLKENF